MAVTSRSICEALRVPGLVVERISALHADVLHHRDLHTFDVVAVKDRFEERVGEAKEFDVLYRSR